MKRARWIAAVVLVGLTAMAAALLVSRRKEKTEPTLPASQEQPARAVEAVGTGLSQFMPAGAVAMIHYRGGEQLKPAYEQSVLGQIFNDSQMQAFLRKPKAAAYRHLATQTNAPPPETVDQLHRWLVGKESTLAVYWDDEAAVVGCVRLGTDAPRAREVLTPLLKGLPSSNARMFKTYEVNTTSGKGEWTIVKDVFAFASDRKAMDALLERIDTGAPASQVPSPPALEVGQKIVWAVLDTPLVLQKARVKMKDPAAVAKFDAVMKELGAEQIGRLEFAAGFDGPAIRTAMRVSGLTAGRGLLAFYGGTPLDDTPLRIIPKDVASANVGRINLTALWEAIMRIVEATTSRDDFQQFQAALEKFEGEVPVHLKKELIDSAGDVAIFYSKPGPAPMMGGEIVLSLALKNPQTFAQATDRLLDYAGQQLAAHQRPGAGVSMSIQRSKVGNVDVSYLAGMPMFSPAYAVSGSRAFLAISPVALNAAIAQAEHPQSSLLDNPDYQSARAKLQEKVVAVSYEDTRQVVAGLYGMIGMIGPMFAGKADSPIDLALLPPLSSIQQKLFGGVSVVTIDGGEFAANQYSALGVSLNSFAGGGTPIMAAMLLPALGQAREKGRRAVCMSNLKQIGLACYLYADKHGDKFPDKLDELAVEYLPSSKVFHCPSATNAQDISYVYVRDLTTKDSDKILAYDADGNHRGAGRNVLFCDGHAAWMTDESFHKLLHEQGL